MDYSTRHLALLLWLIAACAAPVVAQEATQASDNRVPPLSNPAPASPSPASETRAPANMPDPAVSGSYVIGPFDILSIVFWREKDLSGDVVVRPDGMISVPLLNDVRAAGLTPVQLRNEIQQAAKRYFADPNATVVVKEINSRKVFITGKVSKAGAYPLTTPTTVLQLIAAAGGLTEFADGKHITVRRKEGGRLVVHAFNYEDVTKYKNVGQDIELQPGDTVIVP